MDIWGHGVEQPRHKGLLERGKRLGRLHLITSVIEHKAILDTVAWMETQGFSVTRLTPDSQGVVSAQAVADAIRPDTLVGLDHAG